ncbi:MAG: hypothetical protein KME31_35350 [Tolypothrix carrinoi HA7290-LM1]|jgi:hypothetical protein|nr:hypothetical protein [Tolypothrix carrinoi HA7290-LM1]
MGRWGDKGTRGGRARVRIFPPARGTCPQDLGRTSASAYFPPRPWNVSTGLGEDERECVFSPPPVERVHRTWVGRARVRIFPPARGTCPQDLGHFALCTLHFALCILEFTSSSSLSSPSPLSPLSPPIPRTLPIPHLSKNAPP